MKFCLKNLLPFIAIILIGALGCKKNQQKKPVAAETAIISFKLDKGQVGDALIVNDADSAKIIINAVGDTHLFTFTPTIIVPPGATVSPASGVTVHVTINGTITYTVTTTYGQIQKWYVTIKGYLASPVAYKDTQVTNFFRRETGHIASDGGFSIPLSNGKVLWLMGDSHINDYRKSDGTMNWLFQVRNAGLLQPYQDWKWQNTSTLIGTAASIPSYIKFVPDDKYWVWPDAGIQLGDTLYVYCANLTKVSGGFGFGANGNDLFATIHVPDMKVTGHIQLQNFNGINFGDTFLKNTDGYVYVYGNKLAFIYNDLFLARFPASNPRAPWVFYDGKGWNADVTKAKSIGQGVSSGVSINKIGTKYVIVSTEFSVACNQGNRIFMSTSNSPVGPFTKPKPIYTITDTVQNNYPFFYAAILHPEYINSKGEVLMTYAINGYPNCLPDYDANYRSIPDRYRLRGIRIPRAVIEAAN